MVRVQLELEWNICLFLVRRERKSRITIFVAGVTPGNEDAGLVQPFPPSFSIFQETFTCTEVTKETFEVNVNEDIEDMDLCDFLKTRH